MKFAITGLARSRTKWASVFLSTPDCPVIHDATFEQMQTACAVSTPLFLDYWEQFPDVKVALIKRDLNDAMKSMQPFGYHAEVMARWEINKKRMLRGREVEVFDYYNLDAKALWSFCHGTTITDDYVNVFEDMNIQQQAMDRRRAA